MKRTFVTLVSLVLLLAACNRTPTPTPTQPVIASFSANPATVTAGGSSTLSWNVTGATSISINNGVGTVTGSSRQVTPTATTTYTLTATNAQGSVTRNVTVTVTPANANAPVINSFSANPATVAAGGSSTLSWNVTGATSISINNGVGTVTGTSTQVSPTATTTYTLTATNAAGSVTAQTTVTVTPVTGTGVRNVGTVFVSEISIPALPVIGGAISASGSFVRYSEPQTIPDDFFGTNADTCAVFAETEPDPITAPIGSFSSLDAGAALTVRSGANPYLTLNRLTLGSNIFYGAQTPLMGELAAGLSVNIPGAEGGFPAFSGNFPSTSAFNLTAPANPASIAKDVTFTWGGSSSGFVFLTGQFGNRFFSCVARDDGSFSLPPATQAALPGTTGSLMTAARVAVSVSRQGDSALVLYVMRGANYMGPDEE